MLGRCYNFLMQPIIITKEDGSTEEFLPQKLEQSLKRAGADAPTIDKIVRTILDDLEKGVCDPLNPDGGICDVSKIHQKALEMLKTISTAAAARYSLRRSIMQFGPSGFPFEEYLSEIYKAKGYHSVIDQVVLGKCVPHEVDVVAWNEKELVMVEAKYHNEQAGKTDLKATLYVKARKDDVQDNMYEYGKYPARKISDFVLITNTKFTDIAIKYAECVGLKIISWGYPEKGNLQDMIEETKLHPITCLLSLTESDKRQLIENKIVLCKSVYENRKTLKDLGFSDEKIFKVMEEIGSIINLAMPKD